MDKWIIKYSCIALGSLISASCNGADAQPDTEVVINCNSQIAQLIAQANALIKQERELAKGRRQCLEQHNLSLKGFQELSDEQRQRIPGLEEKNAKLRELKEQSRAVSRKLTLLWGQELKDDDDHLLAQE